jgi:hypothetical protein
MKAPFVCLGGHFDGGKTTGKPVRIAGRQTGFEREGEGSSGWLTNSERAVFRRPNFWETSTGCCLAISVHSVHTRQFREIDQFFFAISLWKIFLKLAFWPVLTRGEDEVLFWASTLNPVAER